MTPHHAIIFDLDGTLVDSLSDIADALNAALEELRQPRASPDEVRQWIGDGLTELCRRALPEKSAALLPRLIEIAQCRYRRHCTDQTMPYRNILSMLDLLLAKGIPLAVFSNKPHAFTEQVIAQLGLTRYFGEIRGCATDEQRKPAPRVALEIAANLRVAPDAVFFVGDSPVDVLTARNAGMIAVGVTWGFRGRQELRSARPDYLVNDPMEIPPLPEKHFAGEGPPRPR